MSDTKRLPLWAWMVPLLLLVMTVAAVQLNRDALWFDEVRTLQKVGGAQYGPAFTPIGIVRHHIAIRDSWPPLYSLAVGGWGQVAGWSPFAGRLLALYAGLLTVALTYRLGTDLSHSARVGLLAAVLLGTSAYHAYYLHEYRGYTLSVGLAVLCLWSYWRVLDGHIGYVALLLLSAVALLYTHYITAFLLGGVGVYHLLFAKKNRRWWLILGVLGLAAASILPWFGALSNTLGSEFGDVRGMRAGNALLAIVRGFGNGLWILLPAALVPTALLLRQPNVRLLWTVTLCFIGLALAANTRLSYLVSIRHLVGLAPVIALLAAFGLTV